MSNAMELITSKVFSLNFGFLTIVLSLIITFVASDSNTQNFILKNCSSESLNSIPDAYSIKELSLDFCDAKNPVAENFDKFSSLIILKITDSNLKNWNNSTLNGLNYLKLLSLPENNIRVIEKWNSKPLNSLNKLELQRNEVETISASGFENFPNLQTLDLSDNILKTIEPQSLSQQTYLNHLNLSYNRLKSINETNFFGLEHLTQLDLDSNEIEIISEKAFETNKRLLNLNLSANKIQNLQFLKNEGLVRLLKLNLTKNSITELKDHDFDSHFELTNLDLSWNSINILSNEKLEGLKSLETLNISHNDILNLTVNSLQPLVSLRELVLASNKLKSLPQSLFNFTPLLEHIDLSDNRLTTIDGSLFSKLYYLTNLKLRGNQLLDIAFTEILPHAQLTLDLSNNHLNSSALNMSQLTKFRKVLIAGNTWNCLWLIGELGKPHLNIDFGHEYKTLSNNWNSELLNLTGIDCYDDVRKRNIVILSVGCNKAPHQETNAESPKRGNCEEQSIPQFPTPPPLVWPKLKADKFDSRSVIIWMLIAIALAFAALRIAQQLLENKNSKIYLRRLRTQRSDATEMEILHPIDEETPAAWTSDTYRKVENNRRPNASII